MLQLTLIFPSSLLKFSPNLIWWNYAMGFQMSTLRKPTWPEAHIRMISQNLMNCVKEKINRTLQQGDVCLSHWHGDLSGQTSHWFQGRDSGPQALEGCSLSWTLATSREEAALGAENTISVNFQGKEPLDFRSGRVCSCSFCFVLFSTNGGEYNIKKAILVLMW